MKCFTSVPSEGKAFKFFPFVYLEDLKPPEQKEIKNKIWQQSIIFINASIAIQIKSDLNVVSAVIHNTILEEFRIFYCAKNYFVFFCARRGVFLLLFHYAYSRQYLFLKLYFKLWKYYLTMS